ncbi:MAG: hypothetical protein JW745_01975, partial [Sedimentisphaerales bacterium]|nr:hypothetical protein [Sedimentisphaerales bacterium]
MKKFRILALAVMIALSSSVSLMAQNWSVVEGQLLSKFAGDVDPVNVLPEYPRPQMVRDNWTNLNGLWDYAIISQQQEQPENWDGKILVPFCVESALSGVKKTVQPDQRLWYRTSFDSSLS